MRKFVEFIGEFVLSIGYIYNIENYAQFSPLKLGCGICENTKNRE